jgi:hypothetical protein
MQNLEIHVNAWPVYEIKDFYLSHKYIYLLMSCIVYMYSDTSANEWPC